MGLRAGCSTCRDSDPWPVWVWPTKWMPEWYLADSSWAATSNWAGLESVAQPPIMMATLGQYSPTCCHSTGHHHNDRGHAPLRSCEDLSCNACHVAAMRQSCLSAQRSYLGHLLLILEVLVLRHSHAF